MTDNADVRTLVEEATLDFTLGDTESAHRKLDRALELDPACFDAWHARAEICLDARDLDNALAAAEKAHELNPDNIHINTSLSRIWMERGDKDQAEHFGARARTLGWKSQLGQDPA